MKASILVVDDSPSKRYVICSWLRRAGYTVTEAETGAAALERVAEERIDLVVLDVRLPDMSGFTVCELIKTNPAHASLPVIHITAAAVDAMDRTQGIARGADAYLVEPIDPDELLATIHAILRYYRSRQHAERIAVRLSMLAGVTTTLNEARSASELLRDAATGIATIFRSPSMACAEEYGHGWLVATCDGPNELAVVRPWRPVPPLPPPGRYADIRSNELGLTWWTANELIRVCTAVSRRSRSPVHVGVLNELSDPGSPVLTMAAQAVAGAFEVLRTFTVEHHLALTLQHSLLPQHLPQVGGVDLAKHYLPASEVAEIGGDFYELFELDGRLVVAVGDVGGHSLHAATVMAELRHAMRAYVVDGHSPGEVLSRLNTLLCRMLPGEIATVFLMTLDPSTGRVQYANAGHPPPLLVAGDEVTSIIEHDPLLGLHYPGISEHTTELPPGATLVLYTDGLVERRDELLERGLERLAAAAANPDHDLDAYCDRLVRLAGPPERLDDIALVAVRRHRTV